MDAVLAHAHCRGSPSQQPQLISGTLRHNLDPFGEYDEATLNYCLRSAGLFDLQKEDKGKIGLGTHVKSGGTNFSLGQRQIIALARAIARRSKLYTFGELAFIGERVLR